MKPHAPASPHASPRLGSVFAALAGLLLSACTDLNADAEGRPAAAGPGRSRQISECTVAIEFDRDGDALDRSAIVAIARAASLAGLGPIVVTGEFANGELPVLAGRRAWRVRQELHRWGFPNARVQESVGIRIPPAPGVLIRACPPRNAPTEPNRPVHYRSPDGTVFAIPLRYLPQDVWADAPYETRNELPPGLTFAGVALDDQFSPEARRCRNNPGMPPDVSGCRQIITASILPRADAERREANSWPPPGRYDETYFSLAPGDEEAPVVRCSLRLGTPDDPMPDIFPGASVCTVNFSHFVGDVGLVVGLRVATAEELTAKIEAVRRLVLSFVQATSGVEGRRQP